MQCRHLRRRPNGKVRAPIAGKLTAPAACVPGSRCRSRSRRRRRNPTGAGCRTAGCRRPYKRTASAPSTASGTRGPEAVRVALAGDLLRGRPLAIGIDKQVRAILSEEEIDGASCGFSYRIWTHRGPYRALSGGEASTGGDAGPALNAAGGGTGAADGLSPAPSPGCDKRRDAGGPAGDPATRPGERALTSSRGTTPTGGGPGRSADGRGGRWRRGHRRSTLICSSRTCCNASPELRGRGAGRRRRGAACRGTSELLLSFSSLSVAQGRLPADRTVAATVRGVTGRSIARPGTVQLLHQGVHPAQFAGAIEDRAVGDADS